MLLAAEIGGVQIEDVHREISSPDHEAGHFRPCGIGDEQCVGADVERRRGAEFAAPHSDGAHVLKVRIQHVRDHAQHVREFAVCNFVLEVADDDRAEVLAHAKVCLAPIKRNSPG